MFDLIVTQKEKTPLKQSRSSFMTTVCGVQGHAEPHQYSNDFIEMILFRLYKKLPATLKSLQKSSGIWLTLVCD